MPCETPTSIQSVVDEAWWPWLTEVIIPVLGVAASAAVAIVALRLAQRARLEDTRRSLRAERAAFVVQVMEYLERWPGAKAGPDSKALIRESRKVGDDATAVIEWARAAVVAQNALIKSALRERAVDRVAAFNRLRAEAEPRFNAWVDSGVFDATPYQP